MRHDGTDVSRCQRWDGLHDVLRWANRRAVAEEVTRRGYRVSGESLNRWVRDEKEFPAIVERIVFDLFTIAPDTEKPSQPFDWDGLVAKMDSIAQEVATHWRSCATGDWPSWSA